MAYIGLADRRKQTRVSLMNDARLTVDGVDHPCSLLDMSAGGAAIVTSLSVPPGSRATLEVDGMGCFDVCVVRGSGVGLAVKFDIAPERANALGQDLRPLQFGMENVG